MLTKSPVQSELPPHPTVRPLPPGLGLAANFERRVRLDDEFDDQDPYGMPPLPRAFQPPNFGLFDPEMTGCVDERNLGSDRTLMQEQASSIKQRRLPRTRRKIYQNFCGFFKRDLSRGTARAKGAVIGWDWSFNCTDEFLEIFNKGKGASMWFSAADGSGLLIWLKILYLRRKFDAVN